MPQVPRGFLPDLAQVWEALEIGFDGQDPLQPAAITLVMQRILHNLANKTWGMQEIERMATSFDRIQFVVQETEETATYEENLMTGDQVSEWRKAAGAQRSRSDCVSPSERVCSLLHNNEQRLSTTPLPPSCCPRSRSPSP